MLELSNLSRQIIDRIVLSADSPSLILSYVHDACEEIIKFSIGKVDEIKISNKRLYFNFDETEELVGFTENE